MPSSIDTFWTGLSRYLSSVESRIKLLHYEGDTARLVSSDRRIAASVVIEEYRITLCFRVQESVAKRMYRLLLPQLADLKEGWPTARVDNDAGTNEIAISDAHELNAPINEECAGDAYAWLDGRLSYMRGFVSRSRECLAREATLGEQSHQMRPLIIIAGTRNYEGTSHP